MAHGRRGKAAHAWLLPKLLLLHHHLLLRRLGAHAHAMRRRGHGACLSKHVRKLLLLLVLLLVLREHALLLVLREHALPQGARLGLLCSLHVAEVRRALVPELPRLLAQRARGAPAGSIGQHPRGRTAAWGLMLNWSNL